MPAANQPVIREVYQVSGTDIPRMEVVGVNWIDALGKVAELIESVLSTRSLEFVRLDAEQVRVDDTSTGRHFELCWIDTDVVELPG